MEPEQAPLLSTRLKIALISGVLVLGAIYDAVLWRPKPYMKKHYLVCQDVYLRACDER